MSAARIGSLVNICGKDFVSVKENQELVTKAVCPTIKGVVAAKEVGGPDDR